MSTRALYHPRDLVVDLADLPRWLYDEIASLHGHIDPPPAAPILTCIGNGEPMYVYRHPSGRYFARHYPHGNPGRRHSHRLTTMSDAHRRQTEYSQRAANDHGLDAIMEKSTGNGTRLDLAVFGDANVGVEIQRSGLSRAQAKTRAAKSFSAGWPTAWVTDRQKDPDWSDHVPTARLTTRDGWSQQLPPRNTAKVIISQFVHQRDRDSRSGWRYERVPRTVTLDELTYLMPAGEIVPLSVGTKGIVTLAFKDSRDVIDSCTYPGASQWRPSVETPRRKEAVQAITRSCHEEAPCECGQPLWAPQSKHRGYCEACALRSRSTLSQLLVEEA